MPSSSVFIEFMLSAIYGSICKHFLFLSEVCFILRFKGHFKAIRSKKKPTKWKKLPKFKGQNKKA